MFNFNACKSDPITIDVEGGPIITPGNGTKISLVETDLCNGDDISYQYEVRPILVSNCAYIGCHNTRSHKSGIILVDYTRTKKQVKSGNPNSSKLYEVIVLNPNDEDIMPIRPAEPLTNSQTAIIKKWIEQGAKDSNCKTECNSDNISFANNIYPLIKEQCYGCHQPNNRQGNISLEDYDHIKAFALNGVLLGTIKQDLGYKAMPTVGNKMTDCQIATIQNWIIDGALNN